MEAIRLTYVGDFKKGSFKIGRAYLLGISTSVYITYEQTFGGPTPFYNNRITVKDLSGVMYGETSYDSFEQFLLNWAY